jgi:hypothetical protein
VASERPLPAETRAYVEELTRMIAGERVDGALIVAVTEEPLFAARAENRPADSQPTSGLRVGGPSTDGAVKDFDGACSALKRSVRPPVTLEFKSMRKRSFAVCRVWS